MLLWSSNHLRNSLSPFSDSILCTLRGGFKIVTGTATFHDHAYTQSRPSSSPPPPRCHSEVWFVKVVCTICIRSAPSLDIFLSDYFSKNLTPSIASNVIGCIHNYKNNPQLAFDFFKFTRTNLKLIHLFATYNILLRSLCQMGFHELAKLVYEYMRIDGHWPDNSLLGSLVSSFGHAGKYDVAKQVLIQVLSGEILEVNSYVNNNLLSLLVKGNRVNEAVELFGQHILTSGCSHVDTCTFNIVIRGLCRIGETDKAIEFFNDMGRFNCFPDVVTYNTLINGFCRVGKVDRGCELLGEIESRDGLSPDVITYTSVISGYCKLGNMEVASDIFNKMVNNGTMPNSVTFNVLIDGYGKKGNMILALNMYEKMLSTGCAPDVVTFTSLIDGHCRSGHVDQGLKLWDEMNVRNLYPNIYTFSILINALCRENRLNEARDLLRQLKLREDIVPLPFIFNPVIDGFCKAGNVDEANVIVTEMEEKRCNPDKLTFTILIIGHCMKGRMFEAIRIFDKMLTIGCAPDAIAIHALISCLLKAGMTNEASRIRQILPEDLNLAMPSLRRTIPLRLNMEIPVAA